MPRAAGRRATLRRIGAVFSLLLMCTTVCAIALRSAWSQGPCCYGGPLPPTSPNCNVVWITSDSVTACPGGDSVYSQRPSRLYIRVHYQDNNCNPRVGVPPESIWVTYSTVGGNVVLNDVGPKVFANDSTNADGDAWITLQSFSGSGSLRCSLFVSGKASGYADRNVRTPDTGGDGRVESTEALSPGDLNYDGKIDVADQHLASSHVDHWHRNALHGTPVRRTNLSYAEGQSGAIGESQLFWSPSGRWLSYTIHGPSGVNCHVFLVPSSPSIGDRPKQFTWLPDTSDYDPTWSPLNTEIAFGRADYRIMRKGIPGLNPDTTEKLVAQSGSFFDHGDLTPAISPDGQWVALGRKDQVTSDYHLWKVPTAGGAATQLTFTPGVADQYPNWSPDGNWIVFDREIGYPNPHNAYKVKANQSAPADTTTYLVYSAGANRDAATPAFSPDNLVVTMGVGSHSTNTLDVVTNTLDPALATPKPITNYADTTFAIHGLHPVLSPKMSPDGTRLGLRSRQIWAVRRNMSEPPRITQVGTQSVVDSTAMVSISAARGLQTTVQVLATDPEGDPITCSAYFLQDGMTFSPSNCTLSWTPTVPVGTTLYVKFQVVTDTWPTENGGSDQIIAAFNVVNATQPQAAALASAGDAALPDGPNPTRGSFALATPLVKGAVATLVVSDLSGRRVASVRGPAGTRLVWDGTGGTGQLVPPGIYLYRMEVGRHRKEGKIVVVR